MKSYQTNVFIDPVLSLMTFDLCLLTLCCVQQGAALVEAVCLGAAYHAAAAPQPEGEQRGALQRAGARGTPPPLLRAPPAARHEDAPRPPPAGRAGKRRERGRRHRKWSREAGRDPGRRAVKPVATGPSAPAQASPASGP